MDLTCVPGCFTIPCPLLPQEDCDLENVWLMGGLSVLTSVPGGPPMVCLLCASKGLHEVGALPFLKTNRQTNARRQSWPLSVRLPFLTLTSQPGLIWLPSLLLTVYHFLTPPSWSFAKSAVIPSTPSVWRRLNVPCLSIVTPGAAGAASSAMSVGAKAEGPRWGTGSPGQVEAWGRGILTQYIVHSFLLYCPSAPPGM